VGLIDVASGELARDWEAHANTVFCVAFTPDGKSLLSSSVDRTIKLWDLDDGSLEHTFEGHADQVDGIAVSPDGSLLLSGGNDRRSRLWDLGTREVKQVFEPRASIVRRVAFSPDGRFFLTSAWDAAVRIRDTGTYELRAHVRGGSDCARLTTDNRLLATTGSGTTAEVFEIDLDAPAGEREQLVRRLIRQLDDEDYDVREAASQAIIEIGLAAEPLLREALRSSSAELRMRSRRLRQRVMSPDPIAKLRGHAGDVEFVCFSPDDKLLATGCRGGDVKIWSVPEFKELRTLHATSAP
jgi:WD40 repeat protein